LVGLLGLGETVDTRLVLARLPLLKLLVGALFGGLVEGEVGRAETYVYLGF
jgi:hypothetical protein